MKTMFVNPSKRRSKSGSKAKRRSKRRNAGIAPFIQANPLILENPRRRRRARRNTSLVANPRRKHRRSRRHGVARRNPAFNVKGITQSALAFGGGAALGFAIDQFLIKKIPVPASLAQHSTIVNTGLRLVGAMLSARYIKGDMGAATAGALMYPAMQELYIKFMPATAAAEADLMADLSGFDDLLDEDSILDGFN